MTTNQIESGRIHHSVDRYAASNPGGSAFINASKSTTVSWGELQHVSQRLAGHLYRLGFRKGDFLAASLPFLTEHIFLEYACFRLGVIHTPLDLRLHPAEVLRCLSLVKAKGFAFLGKTPLADFSGLGEAVRANCPFIEHLVQFAPPGECIAGAIPAANLFADAMAADPIIDNDVSPGDGAQVIFTTGSTGAPKPALLSHGSITAQNRALAQGFRFGPGQRVLVNLPASHVGGQSELLMTSIYSGGTAVVLEIFDPAKSLQAIEQHKVTLLGQIPAMFNLEWRQSDYAQRDLSSLETVVYGGQAVPRPFLEKLATMGRGIATGLGLTEASGFCTYTPITTDPAVLERSIGFADSAYPMTIRQPMRGDGAAGDELPQGEVGHVCFRGEQTFLGYVNDPEATARAISSDGYLYTGDLGFVDQHGLHFSGRAKWVIKPGGNQVFPGDVESFLCSHEKVSSAGVVGVDHAIWSEAIVAFVEQKPGAELTAAELKKHARGLTSYMRPLHYVILDPGQLPLNRVAKVDTLLLKERAREEVRLLRSRGRWDGDNPEDSVG
jgi:acyl-CoA synthetase (AMP-forming)/AMP-acid ligase II